MIGELLQLMFDEKLLATGKKGKKNSIKEQYESLENDEIKKNNKKKKKTKSSKIKQEDYDNFSKDDNYAPDKKPLWREVLETIVAGLIIAAVYFLIFNK